MTISGEFPHEIKEAIALAILVIGSALLGSCQTGNSQRAEEEIRRLNAEEVKALLGNDVKALGRIWSDDFVVTNPLNELVKKQQVVGLIDSGVLAFTSYDRRVEYLRIYGETAVLAGSETVVWAGRMPNAGRTSHLRYTAIWMRQGGRWQEIARHANIVE
jgi:hypothetical protein